MCGIFGYVGNGPLVKNIKEGLARLEYRGYDSVGIAVLKSDSITVEKKKGMVHTLSGNSLPPTGDAGIGHTRWATHGEPNAQNAHPHTSEDGKIAIVHNGIIENNVELKKKLLAKGYSFSSLTDSELFAHLIRDAYTDNLLEAVRKATQQVEGSFALAVIAAGTEGIVIARQGSPLIIGLGEAESYIASDLAAIAAFTKKYILLKEGELAHITAKTQHIENAQGVIQKRTPEMITWDIEKIEKKGLDHYMLKEIFEQPDSIKDCFTGRIDKEQAMPRLGLKLSQEQLAKIKRVLLVGCGTSWHAALYGEYLMERFLNMPVEVEYASEFRYRESIIKPTDLVIVISQSGETADTLAALRKAKEYTTVLGIVNVMGSTIARESDGGVYIRAGPEIGVASTKAFTGQLVSLLLLTSYLARELGTMSRTEFLELAEALETVPGKIRKVLQQHKSIQAVASKFKKTHNALYLGRGLNFPVALEGALKLKEISYIHAEGYPAAEMKHGPIALIDEHMPVVVIVPTDDSYAKVLSNIEEIKARKGNLFLIATEGNNGLDRLTENIMYVPEINPWLTPLLSVIPLQILAYYAATSRGLNPDKPRNLAKSVTVE